MNFRRKIAVITGGASQFGYALASQLSDEGARVIIADTNEALFKEIAIRTGAIPVVLDRLEKSSLKLLVDKAICLFGRVDLFVSNTENVMAQMYAAKFMLPHMLKRCSGYFVNTIPMDGLQNEFHLPLYSTLKHPALSFGERLATTYKDNGIRVSLLCIAGAKRLAVSPSGLAKMVVQAIHEEKFMITPGRKVATIQNNRSGVAA